MSQINVVAKERTELGKGANRRLRRQGRIPAVCYGRGREPRALSLETRDVDHILYSETGHNTIFKLELSGDRQDVLIKEYQLDPVKGVLIHADLQVVAMDEKMTFDVPIQIEGIPQGVTMGGVLDIVTREIEVECLPSDVPDHIHIDVSALDIGDSIRVESLKTEGDTVSILSDPEQVVVVVVPPTVEKEPEEVVEEAGEEGEEGEPEVIKKGKAEDDEGAGSEKKDEK